MTGSVVDNPAQLRFELRVGDALAVASYRLDGDQVVLVHTEVPAELSGRGVGSRLAEGASDLIRESGRKAVTKCSFMAEWASRHPECADLVVA
ncbi:MAG TPA: GNAT family N-acetyltransferase [Microvirga sp.]|nr:GNAT family N-acetyltransferase [Microvirga sp.]